MGENPTAITFVSIGIGVQAVVMIGFWAYTCISIIDYMSILPTLTMSQVFFFVMLFAIAMILTIYGLVLMSLWYRWRIYPSLYRVKLIISGLIGILLIGGIFVFIGGILALPVDEEEEVPFSKPTTPYEVADSVKVCPHCGAEVRDPKSTYCARCGAFLEEEASFSENTQ